MVAVLPAIVGPIERIVRDLNDINKGLKRECIRIRKGDKLGPLVNEINALIDKLPGQS